MNVNSQTIEFGEDGVHVKDASAGPPSSNTMHDPPRPLTLELFEGVVWEGETVTCVTLRVPKIKDLARLKKAHQAAVDRADASDDGEEMVSTFELVSALIRMPVAFVEELSMWDFQSIAEKTADFMVAREG
jgi:hypothetical protein